MFALFADVGYRLEENPCRTLIVVFWDDRIIFSWFQTNILQFQGYGKSLTGMNMPFRVRFRYGSAAGRFGKTSHPTLRCCLDPCCLRTFPPSLWSSSVVIRVEMHSGDYSGVKPNWIPYFTWSPSLVFTAVDRLSSSTPSAVGTVMPRPTLDLQLPAVIA